MSISLGQLLTDDVYAKQIIDKWMQTSPDINMESDSIFSVFPNGRIFTRSGLIKKYIRTDFHHRNNLYNQDFKQYFGLEMMFDYASNRYQASSQYKEMSQEYFIISNSIYTIPPRVVAVILLTTNSPIPRSFRKYIGVEGQRAQKAGLFMNEIKEYVAG